MRLGTLPVIQLVTTTSPLAFAEGQEQPTTAEYAKHAVGPAAIVRAGAGAAVNQANDTPSEWGQGAQALESVLVRPLGSIS